MTSSMMAGERRWASSRRGGMTVLGKVPKPFNLPSQKLENHGLDPNVEIVPKGSLSWGSRPSSSSSNPWGSSALSPNADGSTGSPSHPSGRPSSGGGHSRPSTAGSERLNEATATTWGPNSRPSSASGVLTSNQSSLTSSRPLSSETRPGSSHLSRFAEPVVDNSVAWGPNGTAEKLLTPNRVDDFSLSSGDFPTLGSEKDNASKGSESHDHGSHVRPGSASGRTAPAKERNEIPQADFNHGTVDTWTRDGPPHVEDGVRPNAEKWQGEPQQYVNPNISPQHYDAWRGPPPMNAPAGVWYRGPPAGAPYPPVPHGGFPMEPFPYYCPQIPSQPGPPPGPGVGPRGHHPKNGDFYRPQMPDAFMRPGMPIRPGFYPGPVPYDGYFGPPPMGYNPNERDIPFMGMPPGPPVYNMYPPQNPSELNGRGPVGNMFVSEQMDSVRPEEPRGPYKVLKKRENERDANIEEENSLSLEKRDQPRPSFHKNNRGTDTRRNEDAPSRRNTFVENPSLRIILGNDQGAFNDNWGKKSEIVAPQVIPANPKDSSLIQKIEGLNAKVRASDVREDVAYGSLREEQKNVLTVDSTFKSTTASAPQFSRRAQHGGQSRADHHNKGRLSNQDNDGWRKKPPILGSEPAALVSNHNVGHPSAFQAPDHQVSADAAENPETKSVGESLAQIVDPIDGQAQRAKMRELAKQRAIQLQKEEEERIREQKAKALAKLEELNRRTLAADGTNQATEKTATSVPVQEDVDGSQKPTEPDIDASKHEAPSSDFDTKAQAVAQVTEPKLSKPDVANATDAESKTAPLVNDGSVPKQKRASHRQKQSGQVLESLSNKSTLIGTVAVIQSPEINVAVSGEAVPGQESNVSNNLNISSESATHPKRRNNKSSKNKPKLDDASQSASREGDLAKVSNLDSSTVLVTDNKDAIQSNLPSEEAHGRATNQYKPQHSRRMPRNPQANRPTDRFHGGDAVVWAPVRAQNKDEPIDEDRDDLDQPEKSVSSVQTNPKSKRAEMERYVPKPVAKELAHAQQGSIQQSAPLSSPKKSTIEDTTTDGEELGSKPAVLDNKQNKQVKPHGAWRQRGGPNEVPREQTNSRKNNQKSTSQHEVTNPVPIPTETNVTHEWDPSDGWYMPEYPPVAPVVKDEGGVMGKGKKPAYKGVSSVEVEKNLVINQTDRPASASSKENHSSHWQPKPQAYRGGRSGQNDPRAQPEDAVAEYKTAREASHGHRERKPASFRGPNLGNMEDEASFEQQQHSNSGFRKYGGGQNNRSGGQDNRRQHNNATVNRERQRQNLHYEYQPVGSNNNNSNKTGNFDAPADGYGNTGPRYKERGSGQPRRGGGNFYGRQSGGVRVEGSYE